MQNLVYERWIYQKFHKFKKILEKLGDFAKNLTHNWTDWYMGHFFLIKNVFVYGFTFKFRGGTAVIPTKTELYG